MGSHSHPPCHHAAPGALPAPGWGRRHPHPDKVDSDKKTAERVMVAVSSTVIPLEDLPETEVGFGFGFAKGPPVKKPAYLKDIKLITSKNKHRFVAPAGVKQLTKKEWEAFSNSVSSK